MVPVGAAVTVGRGVAVGGIEFEGRQELVINVIAKTIALNGAERSAGNNVNFL